MYVRSLYLQQFRNYKEAYFEFSPSLNLICGPNARGKTNTLEALYYLMMGRSFRGCLNQGLIHTDCSFFYLEAIFCKHEVDQKLRIHMKDKEREMIYNSTSIPHLSNLLGLIQGVIMTPDDASLVKGSPALRRQFLDIQIAQVDPLYVHYLMRYTKAMRQRNQLLKQKQIGTIESWEHEMAQAAAYLVMQRRYGIQALEDYSKKFYSYLTEERESLNLGYSSHASLCQNEKEIKEFYLKQFKKNRSREMMLGYTIDGPHKDDVFIKIGGRDVRYFASEGQQRSCVAALRIAEWQRLKDVAKDNPLLMIDDIGIGLDHGRCQRLMSYLIDFGQVFLTTTDSDLLNSFNGPKKIFPLESIDCK